jgi:hypothetical protein
MGASVPRLSDLGDVQLRAPPSLFTGYDLPFAVQIADAPLLSTGGDVELRCAGAPGLGASSELRGAVDRFVRLARTGALGSSLVAARSSGIEGMTLSAGGIAVLGACRVDERAALILTYMLFAQRRPLSLRSVKLLPIPDLRSALRPPRRDPDEESSLPDHPDEPPFELIDEDPGGRSRTFTVEFSRNIGPEEELLLTEAFGAWADVVSAGGYGLAPIPPEESYIESEPPAFWGSGMEYSVLKLDADPQAVEALINLFVAFHHRGCPLVSLTIS